MFYLIISIAVFGLFYLATGHWEDGKWPCDEDLTALLFLFIILILLVSGAIKLLR